MRVVPSSAAAIAGAGLVLVVASAGHATVRPVARPLTIPSRTVSSSRQAVRPQAQQSPASCSAATPGPGAYDSSFTFSTNKGAATFGYENLAAAGYAGAIEGSGNTICDYNSVIAGGYTNTIDSGSGNTPKGAAYSFIGAGSTNTVRAFFSFLGAGIGNRSTGSVSFIGAGSTNTLSAHEGFIGAGYGNDVTGDGSFVGGGGVIIATAPNNEITGEDSFIGAGDTNVIDGNEDFIGSGRRNDVTSTATYAGITSGFGNVASGEYSTVVGGLDNTAAGELSFAGGYQADAANKGSFVWSGFNSGAAALEDTAANQFVVRSSGGVYFYSNAGDTSGVKLAAGSGTWSSLSDRNAKTDIVPLNDTSILAKVAALPVSTWRYKSEAGVRHVGPMAQDFYAAFGVGEDNRHITSIDEDGVALAAIKALHRENDDLRASQDALRKELRRIEAAYAAHETD